MNTNVRDCYRIIVLLGLLISVSLWPSAGYSQQTTKLERIQFTGLKKLSAAQAIELSGLKIGQSIDASILDAAAARLLESGLFRKLGYSVHSPNGRATVTFAVEESAVTLPVVFEDFVWFSDEDILTAIRRDVPFFNGTAPASGDTTDKITADLQRLLNSRNIAGHVESFPNVTKDKLELVFTVKGAKIPVCVVRFPGAAAIPEAQLMQASRPLLNIEYSRKDITAFVDTQLTPLYRRLGHLRAEFQPLKFMLTNSPQCAGGVDVSVPVEEGLSYRWVKSVWDGNEKLTIEELAAALGMNPGDLADGTRIDDGLKKVAEAYPRHGYLSATIKETVEYDDGNSGVIYRFRIVEGARSFMGKLIINGLPAEEEERLRSKWTLGSNAVYDQTYVEDFEQKGLREFIAGLAQRMPGSRRAGVGLTTKPDPQKQTVDVIISFNQAQDREQ
jgi:outer membrane protein assembly factor BamA